MKPKLKWSTRTSRYATDHVLRAGPFEVAVCGYDSMGSTAQKDREKCILLLPGFKVTTTLHPTKDEAKKHAEEMINTWFEKACADE